MIEFIASIRVLLTARVEFQKLAFDCAVKCDLRKKSEWKAFAREVAKPRNFLLSSCTSKLYLYSEGMLLVLIGC